MNTPGIDSNVMFHSDPTSVTKLRAAIHKARENSVALLGGGNVTVMDSTLVDRIQAVLLECDFLQHDAANNAPRVSLTDRAAAIERAARI
jgi:hypothetical protein